MSENLKQTAMSGMMWGFISQFSMRFVTFVVGIILARLLSPSDYGLIAMTAIFTEISSIIVDSGFSTAIIRKKERTELDYSTVFVMNVLISIVVCLLLFACSGSIAKFYKEPLLKDIIRLNGLFVFLGSFIAVQSTRMAAEMKFKTKNIISIVNTVIGGIISVGMAFAGFGVWALVFPRFFRIISDAVLYWFYQRWFPRLQFSWTSCRELFSFGSKMMASSVINVIYNNIYPIVIGKRFSSADLGLYSKASGYAQLPSGTITGVVGSVALPILSNIQDDDERLRESYRKLIRLTSFLVFPVMFGMAALARPLVIVLITEKWLGAVLFLQILCFDQMLYPIHGLNLSLLQVKGRSDLFLRLEIIKKALGIIILLITIPYGIVAMCIGSVIVSYLSLLINTHYTSKFIHVGFYRQMRDLVPSYLISLIVALIVWGVISLLPLYSIQLLVGIILLFAIYFMGAKLFMRKDMIFLHDIIHERFKK